MNDTKITVLYHKNCIDGLVAALNFYALYKEQGILDNVIFFPVQYSDGLPPKELLENRFVVVLDFSFSYANTLEIIAQCENFLMLDHHQSAIDNLFQESMFPTAYVKHSPPGSRRFTMVNDKAHIVIDKDKSGATLAYDAVSATITNVYTRIALGYISTRTEDRDNWKFEFYDSKALHEYLSSLLSDVSRVYDAIFNTEKTPMEELQSGIEWGNVRVEFRAALAKSYAAKAVIVPFMGYDVPVVNVSSDFASIVGDFLGKENPFAVMYVVTADKVLVSLRSNTEKGVNVKYIAAKFGGGGHDNAAGFSIPHDMLGTLVTGKLGPCHPFFDNI